MYYPQKYVRQSSKAVAPGRNRGKMITRAIQKILTQTHLKLWIHFYSMWCLWHGENCWTERHLNVISPTFLPRRFTQLEFRRRYSAVVTLLGISNCPWLYRWYYDCNHHCTFSCTCGHHDSCLRRWMLLPSMYRMKHHICPTSSMHIHHFDNRFGWRQSVSS